MAINPFVMKKYAALLMTPLLVVIMYMVGNLYYGFMGGMLFLAIGMLVGVVLSNFLLDNPFRLMIEGKGIMCIDMNSTGIIQPFIVSVQSPFIIGNIGKKSIKSIFNRDAVFSLKPPIKAGGALKINDKKMIIELDEDKYNKSRFAMSHYPVLLYNRQINDLMTKDFLSDLEKEAFAEHSVLYLNKNMEELTSAIRDFGRHVVESLRPKINVLQSKFFWIVVVVLIAILAMVFAPRIIETLSAFMGSSEGIFSGVGGGSAITPR